MSVKKTTEQFRKEVRERYGDLYGLELIDYVNGKTKVKIVCPKHGIKEVRPDRLLNGRGCPECGVEQSIKAHTKSLKSFIEEARAKHGDKYDYSLITEDNYIDRSHAVQIICPTHGKFEQTPNAHLRYGCKHCGYEVMADKQRTTREKFIQQAKEIHNNYYTYDNVGEVNLQTDIVYITCPKHGDFPQSVNAHLQGHGCPACGEERRLASCTKTLEQFKDDMRRFWGDEYILDHITEYVNNTTEVPVECRKHGIFYKTPNVLLRGHGCNKCKRSWGEKIISTYLNEKNVRFEEQHAFPNEDLFCTNKRLVADFYLPDYNLVIEFNGRQHYEEIEGWRGKVALEKQQLRDSALRSYCQNHKIKLIEIPYTKMDNIKEILDGSLIRMGGRRGKKL